jgi:hypothetical protein
LGKGTGDWKVARTGRLENLPYMGGSDAGLAGRFAPPFFEFKKTLNFQANPQICDGWVAG